MSRWRGRRPARGDDRGISLTELVVTASVLAVVLPLVGGLLVNAVETQRDVRAVTDASASAQVVVASVENGVRNASALRRTASGVGGADELLVARASTGSADAPTWRCVAWFYSAERDVLYRRSVPASLTTTPLTAPTASTLEQWTVLAERVVPRPEATGVLTLSADGSRVDVAFSVGTGTPRPATTIATTVVRRPQSDSKGTPCF